MSSQYTFEQLFGMVIRMLGGNRSTIVGSEIENDGPGCLTGTEDTDGGLLDYEKSCALSVINVLNNYRVGISGACCVPTHF